MNFKCGLRQMKKPICSVKEFVEWTEKLEGQMLLYRGLADIDWELESSANRRIRGDNPIKQVPAVSLQNYIQKLLDVASLRGFRRRQDRELYDLELLAELQHYGAATCLIDFTNNALTALWFACQEKPNKPGKVIAIATHDIEIFSTVNYENLKDPIQEFLNLGRLWKWSPASLGNNRAVVQQSVFVFGEGKIEKKYYDIIVVDKSSKKTIREELAKRFGIDKEQIFSDFTGFALSNAHDRPYDFTAEDYFHLGLQFNQQLNYEKAIENFSESIALNSSDITYLNRGIAECRLGNYQEGIKDFDRAIEINPQYALAYYNRGVTKGALGGHDEAIQDYDRAIELDHQYVNSYVNRGASKSVLGNYQEGIKDFDRAIELNPQYAEAHYNRGKSKVILGNHQEAIEDFDRAIELNPQYTSAYSNRGVSKSVLGNHQEAIEDFDRAIELDPKNATAYYNRGNFKHKLGDEEAANDDFAKAVELDPNMLKH